MPTGRRGRPEQPLDTSVPALAELARELRGLRAAAGLTLARLSADVNWSKGALSAAASGRSLPRWELVRAWVQACDPEANLDLWQARYARARAEHQWARIVPPQEGQAAETQPGPRGAAAPAGLRGGLRSDPRTGPFAGGVPGPAPATIPVPAGPAGGEAAAAALPAGPAGPAHPAHPADPADPGHPAGVPAGREAAAGPDGPGPGSLERDAWRTLAPDRRPWGVAAHPAPIRLRYTTVNPDFTDAGPDAPDLGGHYDEIAEVHALARGRRLLILGDRGSGKTQLARHLGTRLLTSADTGAMPVLVSLRGWRPQPGPVDDLLAWIAGALTGCTAEDVRTLLGRHLLLPILDDFDSLTLRQRACALHLFNRLPEQAPFVLVSGWAEFTDTVERTDTVIAGSAGVRLRPLCVDDLDGWIQRSSRSRTKQREWAPVLEALAARPDLPAAAVLADPTLAGAARLLYTDGRADPAELVAEDATEESLQLRLVRHLFGAYLPYRQYRGPFREQRRHAALRLLAFREKEEGGPVGDLRVLYRGRRPSRWQAAAYAALTGALVWLMLSFYDSESRADDSYYASAYGTSDSGEEPLWFLLGVLAGFAWYVYQRHRLDPRAARGDPVGRVWQGLLKGVPGGLVLLFAVTVPDSAADILFLMGAALLLGFTAWSAERAVRPAETLWIVGDVMAPLLCLVLLLAASGACALLLPLLAGTTVTGHWIRAVVSSRFAAWGLPPHTVHRLLDEAAAQEVLRAGPDGWSFTHPAVARWYLHAPSLPEFDGP
ncbi:helix-turn-helix domain-containing protein [Streptomyces globosus]|uniref:helix-turn-helix domain-containing protein n=1 Tax=Streptomyces globosus TaxID=68209 RepID=UPI0037FC2FB7